MKIEESCVKKKKKKRNESDETKQITCKSS